MNHHGKAMRELAMTFLDALMNQKGGNREEAVRTGLRALKVARKLTWADMHVSETDLLDSLSLQTLAEIIRQTNPAGMEAIAENTFLRGLETGFLQITKALEPV